MPREVVEVDFDALYNAADPLNTKGHWHYPWVFTPRQLALWKKHTDLLVERYPDRLGTPVPTDVFVWGIRGRGRSVAQTQIGGTPWREADRPWPTGKRKRPLQFIAQISFVDSHDLFDFDLPGDVLCIYGLMRDTELDIFSSPIEIEWNPAHLEKRVRTSPSGCELHQAFYGYRTRVLQYPEARIPTNEDYDDCIHIQSTLIGSTMAWPQGDPEYTDRTLVCALSSTQLFGQWPLVDCEHLPAVAEFSPMTTPIMISDMGILGVTRDRKGRFSLTEQFF